ncbi:unnamed protein product [Soboliphyme baturini]|uniref:CX9C domain-containing protein n=1 Tax=Soboliphyme baturini TaxID=241478 RepID=A0A183IP76_9BILA|nr:unnamed protein product [Soboliphyme baturini]
MDQCVHHSPANQERLKHCIGKAKNDMKNDKRLCTGIRECYRSFSKEPGCSAAITRINSALTQCINEKTRGKMPKFFTQITKDFARGEMEQAFKKCHAAAGVPYPTSKMESIKRMIRGIAVDMAKRRGTPDSVTKLMHVMNNVVQDMTSQWIASYSPACIRG